MNEMAVETEKGTGCKCVYLLEVVPTLNPPPPMVHTCSLIHLPVAVPSAHSDTEAERCHIASERAGRVARVRITDATNEVPERTFCRREHGIGNTLVVGIERVWGAWRRHSADRCGDGFDSRLRIEEAIEVC